MDLQNMQSFFLSSWQNRTFLRVTVIWLVVVLHVTDPPMCWDARAILVSSHPVKISIHVCALEAHRKHLIKQLSLAYVSVMFLWSLLVKKKKRKIDASLFAPIYFQAVCMVV